MHRDFAAAALRAASSGPILHVADASFAASIRRRGRHGRSSMFAALLATTLVAQTTGYPGLNYGDARLPGRSFGASVAFVGDVDGDGVADFVAGDPGAGGAAFYGRGEFRLCSGATGATLTEGFGAAVGERLGHAVAGLGDIDGDSVPDFAISAPGRPPGGAVDVYSGATRSTIRSLAGTATSVGSLFVSTKPEGLGSSLANVGDFDGDGVPDLAAGADEYSIPVGILFINNVGRVRVFSGANGAVLATLVGGVQWDGFGAATASVGDLNGDGFAEIAVGAPQTANPFGSGYVSVFFGGSGAPLTTITAAGPGFGSRIATVGDVDGDGIPDAFVGSSAAAATGRIYSGQTASVLYAVPGSVGAAAGDVDGDGSADFYVGDPFFALVGGSGDGRVDLIRGANGSTLRTWSGGSQAAMGTAIAGGPDLDGDGIADGLLGSPTTDGTGGSILAVSGAGGAALFAASGPTPVMPPLLELTMQLGSGRADVNGDGVDDLLVALRGNVPVGLNALYPRGEMRAISGADGSELARAAAPVVGTGAVSDWSGYGAAATWTGDVDGDGVPDFAVTAPSATGNGGVTLQSGATGAAIIARDEASLGVDFAGASMASPGDLDGDGVGDLVVGCPSFAGAGIGTPPTVLALSGAGGATIWAANPAGGAASGLAFGFRVFAVGDVNGDGSSDVAVPDFGSTLQGKVEILSGARGSVLTTVVGLANEIAMAVCDLGDLTGDFIPDFAIAWFDFATQLARIEAYSASTGAGLWVRVSTQPNDGFGASLVFVGDVDGDGLGDAAAGAPNTAVGGTPAAGRVHVLSGADGGTVFEVDGWSDSGLGGGGAGVRFGQTVAAVGDRDGDGSPEIAVLSADAETTPCLTTWSWTGTPTGSSRYGSAAPGFLGRVPSIAVVGGALEAAVGNPVAGIALTNVRGGSGALLVLGLSSTSWVGGPLPLDLTPFGVPGVSLSASPDSLVASQVDGYSFGLGACVAAMPLPANPALSGFTLHAQWFVDEPTAAPLPLRATKGLQLVVQ